MLNVETANLLQIAAYLETGEPSGRLLEERLRQLHEERTELLKASKRLLNAMLFESFEAEVSATAKAFEVISKQEGA
jgi:hypothetical protein